MLVVKIQLLVEFSKYTDTCFIIMRHFYCSYWRHTHTHTHTHKTHIHTHTHTHTHTYTHIHTQTYTPVQPQHVAHIWIHYCVP